MIQYRKKYTRKSVSPHLVYLTKELEQTDQLLCLRNLVAFVIKKELENLKITIDDCLVMIDRVAIVSFNDSILQTTEAFR